MGAVRARRLRTSPRSPRDYRAPEGVPRRNGELAFDAPWERRAFGLAAAYVEATGCGWARFRRHLATAIADAPADTPYYESWLAAFGSLLAQDGIDVPGDRG
ncbi:MAG TPA: hypothetical protein VK306_11210 [Acidimicrobiales bacterium]|nr:hypothetical protein [Acidimicrobiales bacterium]